VKSAFYDVIILQTVLEELRNRSLPLYNRLIGLTKSEDKRFYVFFNDFRVETYITRENGETINDRNDRAVRRAVKWYNEHLAKAVKAAGGRSKSIPVVVMLSDDKENLRKAKEYGIAACSLKNYVKGLKDADRLLDMISAGNEGRESRDAKATQNLYQEYYSLSKMMTGVKNGILHQGIFNVSPYNYLEGSIHAPAFDKSLLVLGRENMNRAIQGDIVVIEVLPEEQWKAPSSKIIEEETLNRNENADAEDGEAVVTEQERRALQEKVRRTQSKSIEGRPQPTAKVVGVIKRNWRQYVGHINMSSVSDSVKQGRKQQTVFLMPMDKRIPKIRVRTRQAGELVGKRVLVAIDSWAISCRTLR
jgi:exosome complex exonuclease DIS3/RRP44